MRRFSAECRADIKAVGVKVSPLGCKIAPATGDYQVCKIIGDGVKLVVYPHKTNQMHYHWRVRDEGSKDKTLAELVMRSSGLKRKA